MPNSRIQVLLFGAVLAGLSTACQVEPLPSENTFELKGLHTELGCADCHDPAEPLGAVA